MVDYKSNLGAFACRGPFSTANTAKKFVEHLLRLLHWTTVRSERSLNGSKRQTGVFAIANKEGGAHRVSFVTQQCSISPRLWSIRKEFESISDTWLLAEQWSFSAQTACYCKQKTKRSLNWTERSPGVHWCGCCEANWRCLFVHCILPMQFCRRWAEIIGSGQYTTLKPGFRLPSSLVSSTETFVFGFGARWVMIQPLAYSISLFLNWGAAWK